MEKNTPQNENNSEQKRIDEFSDFVQEGRQVFEVFVDFNHDRISPEEVKNTISAFLKKSLDYSMSDMEDLLKKALLKSQDPGQMVDHILFRSISVLRRNYTSEADIVKDFAVKTIGSLKGVMRSVNQDIEQFDESSTQPEKNKNHLLKINQQILEFFDTAHSELSDIHFENAGDDFLNSFKHHYRAILNKEEDILGFWYPSLLNKISTLKASETQKEVFDLLNSNLDKEILTANTPITDEDHWRKSSQEFIYETAQLSFKDEAVKEKCFAYIDTLLSKFNLKTENIFNPWFTGEKQVNDFLISEHLQKMNELEDIRPGSVKVLFEEFGLTLFRKYPIEALKDQFDQRNTDIEYGVYATSHEGSEDALSNEKKISNYDFLKENNTALRYFEFTNIFGLLRFLKRLDNRYGNKNKISFGVVNVHGGDDGKFVLLGGTQQKIIEEKDLTPERVNALKSFFIENPHFLFLACETGKENGIAESFSKISNAVVIAPKISINAEEGEVLFIKENGHLVPQPVEGNKELFSTFTKKD